MIYEASQVALDKTERRRAIRLLQQVVPEDDRYAEAMAQLARVLEDEGHGDLAAERLADYVRAAGDAASRPTRTSPRGSRRCASAGAPGSTPTATTAAPGICARRRH